jgi:hypothetical protein
VGGYNGGMHRNHWLTVAVVFLLALWLVVAVATGYHREAWDWLRANVVLPLPNS